MAVHLPAMYTAGCSGCVRITERHRRHVNYLRIVALGIRDERFSSHDGGDGRHEIKGGECLSELRQGDGTFIFKPWNQYGEKPPSGIEGRTSR